MSIGRLRFCVPFPMFPAEHVLALAPVAEQAGFHMIAVPDSVFFPEQVSADYPYSPDGRRFWAPDTPFVDPVVAIAAIAALTTRIRFVTNVLKTPLRDPLILAKQVSSLAVVSRERLELGVGLSWIPEEFAWTGTDMRTRGARLDEQIEILREVCGGGGPRWIEHHGRHYDVGRLMISPAPQERVPIHVGGHSEPALERAARAGDGWISVQATSDEIRRCVTDLARRRNDHGRADQAFVAIVLPIDIAPFSGLDAFQDLADDIAAHGIDPVFQVVPWYFTGGDPETLDVRRAAIARFGDDVIARA